MTMFFLRFLFHGHSYGFSKDAHLQITKWRQDGFKLVFDLTFQGKTYADVELALIGKHNIENGAAVFGMALELGIPEAAIREAFKTFKGVKRRLEKKGEKRAVSFYDDYAHHPTEIVTTLKGIRQAIGEKETRSSFPTSSLHPCPRLLEGVCSCIRGCGCCVHDRYLDRWRKTD